MKVPAYMGQTVDHLYQHCPLLKRTDPNSWPEVIGRQTAGLVDPLGTDICGWCQNVWRSRHGEVSA